MYVVALKHLLRAGGELFKTATQEIWHRVSWVKVSACCAKAAAQTLYKSLQIQEQTLSPAKKYQKQDFLPPSAPTCRRQVQ